MRRVSIDRQRRDLACNKMMALSSCPGAIIPMCSPPHGSSTVDLFGCILKDTLHVSGGPANRRIFAVASSPSRSGGKAPDSGAHTAAVVRQPR